MAFAPPPFLASPGQHMQYLGKSGTARSRRPYWRQEEPLANLGFARQRLYWDLTSQVDPETTTFQDILRILEKHHEDGTNCMLILSHEELIKNAPEELQTLYA
ncbi:uncharacterized protein [Dermacentor albipictus]|uniref:uncharacterized protein n=1 Tax=Dermacentor albipictus TaxID=60249 RepID=UPI0038FCA487